ncbi:hypothetical protein FK481_0077 [Listeria phage LP-010]|uniref:Uncharacterized protein n=3 Tax=Homburgvirus TaxID=1921125 RepID=A0A6C0R271_9CAUD|nr:hypothetical protein FK481_0077 [Listeria phage LP-010]QDK04701.1 hypothetical protein FK482_0079 [Listeria phage LP-013]QHZ59422.1 hypothetical protein FK483_0079 [Listeria phage LP-018]
MKTDFEWNYYEMTIELDPEAFLPSNLHLHSKTLYTEEAMHELVTSTFYKHRDELIVGEEGEKYIDSVRLAEIIADTAFDIVNDYPFNIHYFPKIIVKEEDK